VTTPVKKATKVARPTKILTKREMLDRVGVSYQTIWNWMCEGKFPRSRLLGDQKVVWLEHEIEQWLATLPVQLLKADRKQKSASA
jgi:predicted DNA-binding transcriptional regulator AlpA